MTILAAALVVLVGLVVLAATFAPLLLFFGLMTADVDEIGRPYWRLWVLSAVLSFAGLVAGVYLISLAGDDEASHCGPGTRYVEHDYRVGKSTVHEWGCVGA